MSFSISTRRLFNQTQSLSFRKLLEGKLVVQVLTSPTTTPYRCNLSSETIQVALDAALAGAGYLSAVWDKQRKSFIESLADASELTRLDTTIHAELALILAMVKGEIKDALPYIGVSKLSCIMCSHYIHAFNEVMEENIATRGSRGKAYPGWSWPRFPSHDEDLRAAFLRHIRQQLLSDFEKHEDTRSLGSGGPELNLGLTADEIAELIGMVTAGL
ncbi:hypothetical protein BGW80DRAFT_1561355 [Lactifluus volemus]|nr:hypothetical protein BGW80DRAFT_1561355 [Lactifluus volemus]